MKVPAKLPARRGRLTQSMLPGFETAGMLPRQVEQMESLRARRRTKPEPAALRAALLENQRQDKFTALEFLKRTYGLVRARMREREPYRRSPRLRKSMGFLGPYFHVRGKRVEWRLDRLTMKEAGEIIDACRETLSGFGWRERNIEREFLGAQRRGRARAMHR